MIVRVRGPSDEHAVDVLPSWSVLQLKEAVAVAKGNGMTAGRLRLIVMGKVMRDEQLLSEFNLTDDHIVHLVVRMEAPPSPPTTTPVLPDITNFGFPPQVGTLPQQVINFGFAPQVGTLPQQVGGFVNVFSEITQAVTRAMQPPPSGGPTTDPNAPRVSHFVSQPPPPISGYVVHVHVSLAELEQLPQRLQRVQQQMAPNVVIHVQHSQSPPSNPSVPSVPSVPSAFSHPTQPPRSTPVAPQAVASKTVAPQVAPSTTAAQLARERFGIDTSTMQQGDFLDVLAGVALDSLGVQEIMRLQAGDWGPFARLRDKVAEKIRIACGGVSTPETRKQLAAKTAKELVTALNDELPLRSAMLQRQAPDRNVFVVLERAAFHLLEEVLEQFLDTRTEEAIWSRRLRMTMVRFIGATVQQLDRDTLRNGRADTDPLLHMCVNSGLGFAARTHPQLQPFLPMVGQMLLGTTRSWHAEYLHVHHRDADSQIFTVPVPVIVNLTPQPGADTRNDSDRLLDEALDEVPPATNRALIERLTQAGIPPSVASDVSRPMDEDELAALPESLLPL